MPLLELVEAVAILKREGVSIHLLYVGDGEAAIVGRMQEAIARLGVAERVSLLGPRSQVGPYVRGCDVGVGGIAFNGVVQDFTASAKPQVLMDTQDNANTPWRDGVNALIVPPGDPKVLAARLRWAAVHRAELAALGRRARSELSGLVSNTQEGGRRYLIAFRTLTRGPTRGPD